MECSKSSTLHPWRSFSTPCSSTHPGAGNGGVTQPLPLVCDAAVCGTITGAGGDAAWRGTNCSRRFSAAWRSRQPHPPPLSPGLPTGAPGRSGDCLIPTVDAALFTRSPAPTGCLSPGTLIVIFHSPASASRLRLPLYVPVMAQHPRHIDTVPQPVCR